MGIYVALKSSEQSRRDCVRGVSPLKKSPTEFDPAGLMAAIVHLSEITRGRFRGSLLDASELVFRQRLQLLLGHIRRDSESVIVVRPDTDVSPLHCDCMLAHAKEAANID